MNSDTSVSFEAARSRLRNTLLDLEEDIFKLKTYDKIAEINTSCDDLEAQVTLYIESAIEHLQTIKYGLIQKINTQRVALLDRIEKKKGSESSSWRQDLAHLAADLEIFRKKCHDAMEKSEQEIESFCDQTRAEFDDYRSKVQNIKQLQRRETFENGIIRFKKNSLFLIDDELIGTIETDVPRETG